MSSSLLSSRWEIFVLTLTLVSCSHFGPKKPPPFRGTASESKLAYQSLRNSDVYYPHFNTMSGERKLIHADEISAISICRELKFRRASGFEAFLTENQTTDLTEDGSPKDSEQRSAYYALRRVSCE